MTKLVLHEYIHVHVRIIMHAHLYVSVCSTHTCTCMPYPVTQESDLYILSIVKVLHDLIRISGSKPSLWLPLSLLTIPARPHPWQGTPYTHQRTAVIPSLSLSLSLFLSFSPFLRSRWSSDATSSPFCSFCREAAEVKVPKAAMDCRGAFRSPGSLET